MREKKQRQKRQPVASARRTRATRAAEIAEAVKPWREALKTLTVRLTLVHADPQYRAVWEIAQNHTGVPYCGLTYTDELQAARALLALPSDAAERKG
jgi:hypothetical protein